MKQNGSLGVKREKSTAYLNKMPSTLKYIVKYIIYNEMAVEWKKLGTL